MVLVGSDHGIPDRGIPDLIAEYMRCLQYYYNLVSTKLIIFAHRDGRIFFLDLQLHAKPRNPSKFHLCQCLYKQLFLVSEQVMPMPEVSLS